MYAHAGLFIFLRNTDPLFGFTCRKHHTNLILPPSLFFLSSSLHSLCYFPSAQMSEVADQMAVRQLMSEMLFHVESKVMSRTTAQYPSNYKFSQINS